MTVENNDSVRTAIVNNRCLERTFTTAGTAGAGSRLNPPKVSPISVRRSDRTERTVRISTATCELETMGRQRRGGGAAFGSENFENLSEGQPSPLVHIASRFRDPCGDLCPRGESQLDQQMFDMSLRRTR